MFKALFQLIMNMAGTIIQLILAPINLIIVSLFPDVADEIMKVSNGIGDLFLGFSWGLDIIPDSIIIVLMFILTCEIAKVSVYISVHSITRVWHVLQKIKFW